VKGTLTRDEAKTVYQIWKEMLGDEFTKWSKSLKTSAKAEKSPAKAEPESDASAPVSSGVSLPDKTDAASLPAKTEPSLPASTEAPKKKRAANRWNIYFKEHIKDEDIMKLPQKERMDAIAKKGGFGKYKKKEETKEEEKEG